MIAGQILQGGLKDGAPPRTQPPPLAAFDRFLKSAAIAGFADKPPDNRLVDPRLRTAYGRDRGSQVKPPRDQPREERLGGGLVTASAVHTSPQPRPDNPTDESTTPNRPASVFTRTDGGGPLGQAAGRPGAMAQTGAAAHRLSPHGPGEAALAEELGLLPPGSAAPEGFPLGEAADELKNSTLQQARREGVAADADAGGPKTAVEALNLSRKAAAPEIGDRQAVLDKLTGENPEARQHIFARGGAAAQEASTLLAQQRPEALAAQLENEFGAGGRQKSRSTIFRAAEPVLPGAAGQTAQPTAAQSGATLASKLPESAGQQMIDRIAQQARWLIRNNRNEVTMKLHPQELGEMKLKVIQAGREMTVELTVDSLAVKRLLEGNLDNLQARLQAENPATQEFNFSVDVRQDQDPQRFQSFASTARRDSLLDEVELMPDSDSVLTRERPLWGRSGVGIYV